MLHPGPESPGLVETQDTKIQLSSVKTEVKVAPGGKQNLIPLKCLGQFPRRDTLHLGSEG